MAIVHGVCQIARVEIIRDGQTAQSIQCEDLDVTVKWVDSVAQPGRHWYLLKVIQTDKEKHIFHNTLPRQTLPGQTFTG